MSEVNFKITLVPKNFLNTKKKDDLLLRMKSRLEKCGLKDVTVRYFEVKRTKTEEYHEIEELKLEIKGKNDLKLVWGNLSNVICNPIPAFTASYFEIDTNRIFLQSHSLTHHRLNYEAFCFGVLPHDGTFNQFARLRNKTFCKEVEFCHDTRNVCIEYEEFEIKFSYNNIRKIFVNIENELEAYFDLSHPPILYRNGFSKYREIKYRNLNLVSPESHSPKISIHILGRANVLCIIFEDLEEVKDVLAHIQNQCLEKSVYYTSISVNQLSKPFDPILDTTMDFECAWLITALLKRNFTFFSQTSDIEKSLDELTNLSWQNPKALEKALNDALCALESGKIVNFWNAIYEQFKYYFLGRNEMSFKDFDLPPNLCLIRSVTLTPTRQLLWPKEVIPSNRVLRKFDAEYAIRVTFREDDLSKFYSCADPGFMDTCIMSLVSDGIDIGGRHYEFLGWSNSQIRDHGFYMYAEDKKGQRSSMIRKWMGNFSHIRNVAKYMARMGQCFSQTEDAISVPLKPHLVRTVDDITGGYNRQNEQPYCFSEGIGRISENLTSAVHKALGHDKLCSAFQIRYGGYKGVLLKDPNLKDVDIEFRKSMKKFYCPNSTKLEIVGTSRPIPLYLNRNIIMILNSRGIQDKIFLQLQEEMLKKLTDMLYKEDEAVNFLHNKIPTDLYSFDELSKSGIYLTTEPFFKALLLALHRKAIESLKSKCRILIEKGRNMMGVLDEYGCLNYGEVFVQYTKDVNSRETTRDTVILHGEVLVTKNPCMNPGDIRKFKAVDKPSLHHIVDCIVFPQTGRRPHPNEMSGSDLDGDLYSVLWDPRLIFGKNVKAADFPVMNREDEEFITVPVMIGFYQEFITNDHVGAIANAHLAHADKKGIFCDTCKVLAEKFSIAVDFPKSGISTFLEPEERPESYPDYLKKAHSPVYRSKHVLGKMFRVCEDFVSENKAISASYENIKVDPDLMYDGLEKYRESALNSRNKYNEYLRSLLRNYGIQHEAEALSCSFSKLDCRFQERKNTNEIQKVIISYIKKLHKYMYNEFMEEFSTTGNAKTITDAMLRKASAWYTVTYSDPNAKFLSFPWIVSNFLAIIKVRRTLANLLPFPPVIMNLDEKITECHNKKLLPIDEIPSTLFECYKISCDTVLLHRALSTLILWVKAQEIIENARCSFSGLNMKMFFKLFVHVSENLGYITKEYSESANFKESFCFDSLKLVGTKLSYYLPKFYSDDDKSKKHFSPGYLCLEFLKFCSTFRFHNYENMKKILPFTVDGYNQLAKCALVSYHNFAVSGTLQVLNLNKIINKELIAMTPVLVNSSIFRESPINEILLEKATKNLKKYSNVKQLNLREIRQIEKVCISATGTEKSLKKLQTILRKDNAVLSKLFIKGIPPKSKSYKNLHFIDENCNNNYNDKRCDENDQSDDSEDDNSTTGACVVQ